MRLHQPLDDAFSTLGHVRILRALTRFPPERNVTGRGIARLAGVSHPQASRILRNLSRQGIVTERRYGGYALYELNARHVLGKAITTIFEFEDGAGEALFVFLAQGVARKGRHVRAAVLYGEAVWGEMEADTALDMVVLSAPDRVAEVEADMARLAEEVYRRFGNRLRPLVTPRRRASEYARRGVGGWDRIAREGVPVYRTFPRVR